MTTAQPTFNPTPLFQNPFELRVARRESSHCWHVLYAPLRSFFAGRFRSICGTVEGRAASFFFAPRGVGGSSCKDCVAILRAFAESDRGTAEIRELFRLSTGERVPTGVEKPFTSMVEALRDPNAEPEKVRELARQVSAAAFARDLADKKQVVIAKGADARVGAGERAVAISAQHAKLEAEARNKELEKAAAEAPPPPQRPVDWLCWAGDEGAVAGPVVALVRCQLPFTARQKARVVLRLESERGIRVEQVETETHVKIARTLERHDATEPQHRQRPSVAEVGRSVTIPDRVLSRHRIPPDAGVKLDRFLSAEARASKKNGKGKKR